MEQRLLEHEQVRAPSRPPREDGYSATAAPDNETSLPPVFHTPDGGWQHARETSADKRNARFRDTHLYGPPPPKPALADEAPRVLLPPRFLVPQELANQGIVDDPRYAVNAGPQPTYPTTAVAPYPYQEAAPEFWIPPDVEAQMVSRMPPPAYPVGPPAQVVLTPSQKKRLRRKQAKERRGGADGRGPSPAPYPLPADRQRLGATDPPRPDPTVAALPQSCGHEALVMLPYQGQFITHRLRCPLTPYPHPNQPHLLQLQSATDDGTEIFVGWWGPGE